MVVVTDYDECLLSILIMMMIMVLMMVITMLRRVIFKMMLIMIIMVILPSEEIFVFGHCTALSTWRDFLRIYVFPMHCND